MYSALLSIPSSAQFMLLCCLCLRDVKVSHNTGRCLRNISNVTGRQYGDSVWKLLHLNGHISWLHVSLRPRMEVLWSDRGTITGVRQKTVTKDIVVVAQHSQVEMGWPRRKNGWARVVTHYISLGRQIRGMENWAIEDTIGRHVEVGKTTTVVKNSQKPVRMG